jgi:DNA-directed RNA polymerase specialized sigma24 family protein
VRTTDVDLRPAGGRTPLGADDLTELLQLAAGGDVDAFTRFYDATIEVVYRFARAVTEDAATADAVTKTVYERAWQTAPAHAGSGLSPLAWLLHGHTRVAMFGSLLRNLWK